MKKSWLRVLGALIGTVGVGLGLVAGCGVSETGGDSSETHFLARCTDSCSGGLECLCGVCTKTCTATSACGALDPSATCEDSCSSSSTKVCDMPCKVAGDCKSLGADFACQAGFCRSGADSSAGGAGQGGSSDGAAGAAGAPAASACHADPKPNPALPALADLDADKVARAAAVIGSCWPDDGIDRNAKYLWASSYASGVFFYQFAKQLDCLADASCGCAGVEHCLGFSDALGAAPDCTTTCDGNVLKACGSGLDLGPGELVTMDCGKLGLKCDTKLICIEPDSPTCDGVKSGMCRPGQRSLACDMGGSTLEGPDCEGLGLGCDPANGKCQGTGAACTNKETEEFEQVIFEAVSCSNGKLEACVDGKTQTIDCATLGPGFSCQAAGGTPFCGLASDCLPAGEGSGSSTNPVSCEGTKVTFCSAGRLETLDCLSLGFKGCSTDKKNGGYGCTPFASTP